MERGCGGETPAGYFTLNSYIPPPKKKKKINQMSAYDMQSTVYIFFQFNNVMKSERNKTLKVVDGFKFRFHKMLNK
jgi:hypothetical protein